MDLLNDDLGPPMTYQQIEALQVEKYPKKDNYDEKCILCGFNLYYNDSITVNITVTDEINTIF